jgi:guanylate kinase
VQGADSLRKAFPDRCLTVFIAPPSIEELERRLRGRGTETEEAIQKRMKNAVLEMSKQPEFDVTFINDRLDETYSQLLKASTQFMDELEGDTWQRRP